MSAEEILKEGTTRKEASMRHFTGKLEPSTIIANRSQLWSPASRCSRCAPSDSGAEWRGEENQELKWKAADP